MIPHVSILGKKKNPPVTAITMFPRKLLFHDFIIAVDFPIRCMHTQKNFYLN